MLLALTVALLHLTPAENTVSSADAAMTAGDFAKALKILQAIDKSATDRETLIRATLLRAECLMVMQRQDEAEAAYAEAIELEPAVVLGPDASPRLVLTLEKVRSKKVGTLALHSSPEGAMALVDDRRVGPLPVSTMLPAGKHRVRLETAGAVERAVEVQGGRITDVALDGAAAAPAAALTAPVPEPRRRSVVLPVTLIAAGGVLAVTGGALFGTSFAWNSNLGDLRIDAAQTAFQSAQLRHDLGLVGLAVGGGAVIAGIIVLVAGGSAPPPVAVAPISGGAMVTWAGAL
jgi:hypothetical protein